MTQASVWIASLTEPVALAAWALAALSVLLLRRRPRGASCWMCLGLTVFYFLAATPLGANLALGAMEHGAATTPACRPAAEEVIVVLAGGVSGVPQSKEDYDRLQEASLRRTIAGVRLARQTPETRLLVSGGQGGASREADLMVALVTALGYPEERVMLERESRNTFESAVNTVGILKEAGLNAQRIYLVTSALHMPRASAVYRARGIEVIPCPADFRWVQPEWYEALIPHVSALRTTTDVWHEVLGYAAYALRGRL